MPAKNTNSKQTTKVVAASAPAPVETAPAQKGGKKTVAKVETTPVVETPVEVVATATKTQKGGKKVAASTPVVETAPVVEVAASPTKTQKGGKKVAATVVETAPVVAASPTPTKTQKGGKKAAVVETAPVVEAAPVVTGGAKGKKAATKKVTEAEALATEVAILAADAEETTDRRIRSFKVRLPGSEDFEGRFTGLTPYQAANKALSKYFRETEKPQVEITFSICESTRKSRKATYTYVGRRQKLDIPVTYKIQDGREIVKNFKNSLKKVKKSDAVTESA
jgi:hypothetical protein